MRLIHLPNLIVLFTVGFILSTTIPAYASRLGPAQKLAVDPSQFTLLASINPGIRPPAFSEWPMVGSVLHRQVGWSPDGKVLALAGTLGLWLYDATNFALPPRQLEQNYAPVISLAFTADSQSLIILTVHPKEAVRRVNIETGKDTVLYTPSANGSLNITLSSDDARLALNNGGGQIQVIDVMTGKTQLSLGAFDANGAVWNETFSTDRTLLANTLQSVDSHLIQIWDWGTKPAGSFPATRTIVMPSDTRSLAFSPDSQWLAAGNHDGTIWLINPRNGDRQRVLFGHTDIVNGVAYDPTGAFLASASLDQTARIWDITTGENLLTLPNHVSVHSVAFSPDGTLLAAVGNDEVIQIWGEKQK